MAIRTQFDNKHTFRITCKLGSIPFVSEENLTMQEALAKASEFEKHQPEDGVFLRGYAKVEMWDGNRYVVISR